VTAAIAPARDYWDVLEALIATNGITLDRPKGTSHPRYPQVVYFIDYGYIRGTSAMDGAEIDIWCGEAGPRRIVGVLSTIDLVKRDSETKVLYGCSDEEVGLILGFYNESPSCGRCWCGGTNDEPSPPWGEGGR
jgi:inorganic pyrophosphatase